jgi:hypothetical protein
MSVVLLGVGSSFTYKYYTRLKMFAMDKHSSLYLWVGLEHTQGAHHSFCIILGSWAPMCLRLSLLVSMRQEA